MANEYVFHALGFIVSLLICAWLLRRPRSFLFLIALAVVVGVLFGVGGLAAFAVVAIYRTRLNTQHTGKHPAKKKKPHRHH